MRARTRFANEAGLGRSLDRRGDSQLWHCEAESTALERNGAREVEEASHAGGAEEERDGTDAGVKARRVGSGGVGVLSSVVM